MEKLDDSPTLGDYVANRVGQVLTAAGVVMLAGDLTGYVINPPKLYRVIEYTLLGFGLTLELASYKDAKSYAREHQPFDTLVSKIYSFFSKNKGDAG